MNRSDMNILEELKTLNFLRKLYKRERPDVVYHVAGIAHVNADPKMESLYYKVNPNGFSQQAFDALH